MFCNHIWNLSENEIYIFYVWYTVIFPALCYTFVIRIIINTLIKEEIWSIVVQKYPRFKTNPLNKL